MVTPQPLDQEDVAFDGTPPIQVPQPMEGHSEAKSTTENQAVEEPQACRFTWTIANISRITIRKLYSDVFMVGGFKWRVLICPKGNNIDNLSMYLDVADSSSLPNGWSTYAQFCLSVVNQIDNRLTVRKDTQHLFHARESDWGFTTFMPLSDFYDPGKGFLVNDTCIIEADIVVRKVVDYRNTRAAKVSTANCKDLELEYVKPVINDVNGSVMIPSDVINRGSLTYSCTLYGFFFEENEIDFSLVDSHIRKMWEKHGIEDVMMNSKGIYFFNFKTDQGMLDALEHGPWSICNTPIFLKRWTPGLTLDDSTHDKLPVWIKFYEIPLELWNKEGLSIIGSMVGNPLAVDSCTARMCMNTFGRAGYARILVDVEATGSWVDEISVSVLFGNEYVLFTLGIEYSWKPPKCSYCNVFGHADSNCKIRLNKEEEEREVKRRYKAQPHLYTIIKVARDEDLSQQIGKDIYFDLVDHDKVRTFYIDKQTPFNLFKEEVAKEFGIPVQFQRFWIWAERENNTYRPDRPLTAQEETQSVGQLSEVLNMKHNAELKLFLETEVGGPNMHLVPPPKKSKDDIFIFIKLYDPNKEEIRYAGRFFLKASGKPTDIISKLNEIAGFSPEEEIELYKETKFEPCVMCECLDKRSSFRSSQIEDGDIIFYQKLSEAHQSAGDKYRYPDVPSFLEYVKNRQMVHFRSLDKPKEDDFCLELSKLDTYDGVVERVAKKLKLDDPSKIRLTPHNCNWQQPMPNPIKYRVAENLLDMLVHYNQVSDILYYEVLDIPLPELQCLKTLKVTFHHATKEETVIHNIRLPKQSTVGDVLNEIKAKVELSRPDAELRFLAVIYNKIYRIFRVTEKIENINDHFCRLRAEEIPEEEKNLGPQDQVIPVYHFTKEAVQIEMQVKNFGEPFFLVIHENETLAAVKIRIQNKLEIPDEEFSKWKFAFVSLGRPKYLEDSDIVSTHFQSRDYGAWEQYLGLEHSV